MTRLLREPLGFPPVYGPPTAAEAERWYRAAEMSEAERAAAAASASGDARATAEALLRLRVAEEGMTTT